MGTQDSRLSKEALKYLFHPDNIKNQEKNKNISKSLNKYWYEYGGP